MRDILDRPICMSDLVIYNDDYYLVIADNTLFRSDDMSKYPKLVTNISNNYPVIKITNYDNEELGLKHYFDSAYIKYTQDLIKTNPDNINIGDVFQSDITYYIYLGMATQKSTWMDANKVQQSKEERLHVFYTIGDFCEAKNIIFEHKGLDIDFLLQYTSPRFKTCKDLGRFLNKVIMKDSFYVTDNSFKTRVFKNDTKKDGKTVVVNYELNFDMNN